MADQKNRIKISWDQGTGYDFLISLHVLHFPDAFGLRGAWAAGVRSRLPNEVREFLEDVVGNFRTPLDWVYGLPSPKDTATVLLSLKQIPENERLTTLQLYPVRHPDMAELLNDVMEKGSWDQKTVNDALYIWRTHTKDVGSILGTPSSYRVETILKIYAEPAAFGRRYLKALSTYYEVFFSEEEKRIETKLEQAMQKAQKLAEVKQGADLLDALGVKMRADAPEQNVVLVPSYWCSTVALDTPLEPDQTLALFGARPEEESLVPGEIVPDDLLKRLKAMTDPTRLRILRYLLQEQLTPAELARRLRLRAPTVTHHLHVLKTAGMVQYVKKGKNEHLYYAKMESIKGMYVLLKDFLEQDVKEVESFDLFDNAFF